MIFSFVFVQLENKGKKLKSSEKKVTFMNRQWLVGAHWDLDLLSTQGHLTKQWENRKDHLINETYSKMSVDII